MTLFQQTVAPAPRAVVGHWNEPVVVDETAEGDVTVGMTGTIGDGATMGDPITIGTGAAELTPRLPISMDPSGMPVRAPPPGVVGDVDVGVDDETTLLDPAPHIPDTPAVCTIPGMADIPDVAPVTGATLPTAIPPPS